MANPIVFRRNSDIGAPDAEADDLFLSHCFTDTGDLATLLDCQNPKCLVLGRTGSGKTALLKQVLKEGSHCSAFSFSYSRGSASCGLFPLRFVERTVFLDIFLRHSIGRNVKRYPIEG